MHTKAPNTVHSLLQDIREITHLAVPKHRYERNYLEYLFSANRVDETKQSWLIACNHHFKNPAPNEYSGIIEASLKQKIPQSLQQVFTFTDGAELFRLNYSAIQPSYTIARYRLLDHIELLRTNIELLHTFRAYIEDRRPSYEDTYLDYIAFCDVNDGNFVAIVTEGEQLGKVFFLDHEYAYYPFREQEEGYPIVAETFESWLSLVRDTKGWDAVGYVDMHI